MADYAIIDHARNGPDEPFLPVGVVVGRAAGGWEFWYLPSDIAQAARERTTTAVGSYQADIKEPDDWGRSFVKLARAAGSGYRSLPVVVGLPPGVPLEDLYTHYVYTYNLPANPYPGSFEPDLDPPFG